MGVDARLNKRTQIARGKGTFVNRSTRNSNARSILSTRTGRGAGGRFTRTQLREAIANQGSRKGGRSRRL